MSDYRYLQIRVPAELQEKIKDAAWTERMSVTTLVNTVLWAYVDALEEKAAAAREESTAESSENNKKSGII